MTPDQTYQHENDTRYELGEISLGKSTMLTPRHGEDYLSGDFARNKKSFDPASSTIEDLNSLYDARKMLMHRENEVKKLHNRISML